MTMRAFIDDVENIAMVERDPFNKDLARDCVDVGHGHDPRNHIGDLVICELLGVDVCPQ